MNRLNLNCTPVEFFQELIDELAKKDIAFPDFSDSEKLIIACDYSGEHKESNYFTVSLILSDFDKLNKFDQGRLYIRDKYKIGERRFEYKKIFRDKITTRGLTGFLRAIDTIPGILLNFSVNKEIEGLFENIDEIKNENAIFHDWKLDDLGKLLWTVHLGSLFIALLTKEYQHIHLLSDNDNIVANLDRKKATVKYFAYILSIYLPHKIGDIVLIVPEEGEKVLDVEDLISIPDLAGGALADIDSVHQIENRYPEKDGDIVPVSETVKQKSKFLANWLAEDNCPLKKLFFRLDYNSDKSIIDYNRVFFK